MRLRLSQVFMTFFVSEATSTPRCKRVEIAAGEVEYWTLKLEIDDEHLDKSKNSLVQIPG